MRSSRYLGKSIAWMALLAVAVWRSPGMGPGYAPPTRRLVAAKAEITDTRLIWARGWENTEPVLLFHRERWFCALKETTHEGAPSAVRVLSSPDARVWQPGSLLSVMGTDLRHPVLSVEPGGSLVLLAEGVEASKAPPPPRSYVWTSADGRSWSHPVAVSEIGVVVRALGWGMKRPYALAFDHWGDEGPRLLSGEDGRALFLHAGPIGDRMRPPTGAWLLFRRDGSALALISGMKGKPGLMAGTSKPPLRAWQWEHLPLPVEIASVAEVEALGLLAAGWESGGAGPLVVGLLDLGNGTWQPLCKIAGEQERARVSLAYQDGKVFVAYPAKTSGRTVLYLAELSLAKMR